MNSKKLYKLIQFVALTLLMSFTAQSWATEITDISPLAQDCIAAEACTLTIQATGGTAPYTWSIDPVEFFESDFPAFLDVLPSTIATLEIAVNSGITDEGTYKFNITVSDSDGHNSVEEFNLTIVRPSYSLMFVLDRSGSMNSMTTPGGSERKWDLVKESVNSLIAYLGTDITPNDQIGLVYFNSSVVQYDGGGLFDMSSIDPNDVSLDMDNNPATGSTGMGLGLFTAHGHLNTEGYHWSNILHAIGKQ